MELMSQREFAKYAGISQPRVAALNKKGRLVIVNGKIDPEPSKAGIDLTKGIEEVQNPKGLQIRNDTKIDQGVVYDLKNPTRDKTKEELHLLGIKAKVDETIYKAENERLKSEITKGEYILKEEVEKQAFEAGKIVKDNLLNLSAKVSPMVIGKTQSEVRTIMDAEVRKIFNNMLKVIEG